MDSSRVSNGSLGLRCACGVRDPRFPGVRLWASGGLRTPPLQRRRDVLSMEKIAPVRSSNTLRHSEMRANVSV